MDIIKKQFVGKKIGWLVTWKHHGSLSLSSAFFRVCLDVDIGPWSEVPLTVMMLFEYVEVNAFLMVYAHACTHVQKSTCIKPNTFNIFYDVVLPENICCFSESTNGQPFLDIQRAVSEDRSCQEL
jgi:hypothetical protein